MRRQPLSYQQQNSSCWITSMLNGMIFLLGDGGRIPNLVARVLYALSSREGTGNDDARDLVTFLSNHKSLQIQCHDPYEGKEVTTDLIQGLLKEDKVIICDTLSGEHSILINGIQRDELLIFDPSWEDIIRKPWERKGAFRCTPDPSHPDFSPYWNVKVSLEYFDQKRTTEKSRFSMGAVSSRFALAMSKR
jgi:hypothetical protein